MNILDFFGIAEKKTEALSPMICKIVSVAGMTVIGEDIDCATRISSRVKKQWVTEEHNRQIQVNPVTR